MVKKKTVSKCKSKSVSFGYSLLLQDWTTRQPEIVKIWLPSFRSDWNIPWINAYRNSISHELQSFGSLFLWELVLGCFVIDLQHHGTHNKAQRPNGGNQRQSLPKQSCDSFQTKRSFPEPSPPPSHNPRPSHAAQSKTPPNPSLLRPQLTRNRLCRHWSSHGPTP